MLKQFSEESGVTLLEMMISLGIVAILVVVGAPNLVAWVQTAQVRTATESISNGLQVARGEAVQRNTSVRFQLTSSTDNTCALSTNSGNWVVSLGDPTSACLGTTVLQAKSVIEGGYSDASFTATITPTPSSTSDYFIAFTGLGRASKSLAVEIKSHAGDACPDTTHRTRCLRVLVSAMGQIQLCDPAAATNDPKACP
jgi:type IV fimbrial biogenesis protein FimT